MDICDDNAISEPSEMAHGRGFKIDKEPPQFDVAPITRTISVPDTLQLLRLDFEPHHGEVWKPRIPSNTLINSGWEDNVTPRVCFTPTIQGAMAAMSRYLGEQELYVHQPIRGDYIITKPTGYRVHDADATKEVWIRQPVMLQCVAKIKLDKQAHVFADYMLGDQHVRVYCWSYTVVNTNDCAWRLGWHYFEEEVKKEGRLYDNIWLLENEEKCRRDAV